MDLSEEVKGQICGMLSLGCDWETAAHVVGCPLERLRQLIGEDGELAARVQRAEGSAELAHMRNVQQAGADPKNWRASVWWLEQRAPERFARRDPSLFTARELAGFVAMLGKALEREIHSLDDRRRLNSWLGRLAGVLEKMMRNGRPDDVPWIEPEPNDRSAAAPDSGAGDSATNVGTA